LACDVDLLAVLYLYDFLRRNQSLTDHALIRRQRVALDLAIDQRPHLVLMPRRRLNCIPPEIHGSVPREQRRNTAYQYRLEYHVDDTDHRSDEQHEDDDLDRHVL